MGVSYFGGGNDKERFALQPPLTWPSEVVGGCKRLGGSYVVLPTKSFFRHNKTIQNLLASRMKFNQVIYPKAKKPHPFLQGIDPVMSLFPISIGWNTYFFQRGATCFSNLNQ